MRLNRLSAAVQGKTDLDVIALVQEAYDLHVALCGICNADLVDGLRCYAAESLEQAAHDLEGGLMCRMAMSLAMPYLNFINDNYSVDGLDYEFFDDRCGGDCDHCSGCDTEG